MAEAKKPASRDISELKARLGLKKSGEQAAVPAPGAAPGAQQGRPAPGPPGTRSGTHQVPAPPGVRPPPGAAPPPGMQRQQAPDPRQDPFAAMSAMTQQPMQAAAPIVIVDDGRGERMKSAGKGRLLMVGGASLLALVIGYLMGGVSYKNSEYNATIAEAGLLSNEVQKTSQTLEAISNALLTARERGQGEQFIPHDPQLLKDLEAIDLAKPNTEVILTSRLLNIDPVTTEGTLMFYTDIVELYDKVDKHIRMTKAEATAKGSKADSVKFDDLAFGAVFDPAKGDKPATVQIVQIGAPVCGDSKPNPAGCGAAPPIGFQFRPDLTAPLWGSKKWAADTIAADQVYFISPTTVFTAMMQGSERFYSTIAYMARVKEIDELTKALAERRKAVQDRLNLKAQEGKRFAL